MLKKKENKNIEIPRDSNEIKIKGHENNLETNLEKENEENKLISIIIMSADQNIHFPVICKPIDKANIIDITLYKEYPELEGTNFYCLCNGKIIEKSESLIKNGIKNGDVLILNKIEKSEEILIKSIIS